MQIYRHFRDLPEEARGCVVAVGNFDGVHLGHRLVIAEAAAVARTLQRPLAVLSFEPHPRSLFLPNDPPFRLSPFRIRARLLERLGIDLHFVLTFDRELANQVPDWFAREVLAHGLGARHVTVGYDFCYGHNRRGTPGTLLSAGQELGFGVTVVTKASDESGGRLSSSRIRDLLRSGRPQDAAELLGRPWEIEGRVQEGDRRGRLLGYPTANVELGDYLRPSLGVYAVRCALDAPAGDPLAWHDGVANVGIRPMFETPQPILEAHLFDFDADIYGRHLRVQLIDYLRPEAKFDGLDSLIAHMDKDSEAARRVLAAVPLIGETDVDPLPLHGGD